MTLGPSSPLCDLFINSPLGSSLPFECTEYLLEKALLVIPVLPDHLTVSSVVSCFASLFSWKFWHFQSVIKINFAFQCCKRLVGWLYHCRKKANWEARMPLLMKLLCRPTPSTPALLHLHLDPYRCYLTQSSSLPRDGSNQNLVRRLYTFHWLNQTWLTRLKSAPICEITDWSLFSSVNALHQAESLWCDNSTPKQKNII